MGVRLAGEARKGGMRMNLYRVMFKVEYLLEELGSGEAKKAARHRLMDDLGASMIPTDVFTEEVTVYHGVKFAEDQPKIIRSLTR